MLSVRGYDCWGDPFKGASSPTPEIHLICYWGHLFKVVPLVKENMERKPRRINKNAEKKKEGTFAIEGISSVLEYLRFKPECIQFVVYKGREIPAQLQDFMSVLSKDKLIPADSYSEETHGLYSRSPVWASAKVESKDEEDLYASLVGCTAESVLVLDHITDPRNLGAILRTAAFYGIKQVVVPKDRQVLLTQSSVGTAQGAFALLDLIVVTNITRVIEQLKKRGFWVLGTSIKGQSFEELNVSIATDNLVFVLGSEDKGLSKGVEKSCDWLVYLEGVPNSLDSLNVSVAAGVFCDRLWQIRKKALKTT